MSSHDVQGHRAHVTAHGRTIEQCRRDVYQQADALAGEQYALSGLSFGVFQPDSVAVLNADGSPLRTVVEYWTVQVSATFVPRGDGGVVIVHEVP